MIAAETILGSSKHEELYYKQMIHSKNKGFITVAEKELEEFKQWHYKYSSLPSLVGKTDRYMSCLLYTSDAADEEDSVDLGGRRIIQKKKNTNDIPPLN